MLSPSRIVVVGLAAYVIGAYLLTIALGDLGDVGFWIVWIPVLAAVLYLAAAGSPDSDAGRDPQRRGVRAHETVSTTALAAELQALGSVDDDWRAARRHDRRGGETCRRGGRCDIKAGAGADLV
jgi:hypothetical protein